MPNHGFLHANIYTMHKTKRTREKAHTSAREERERGAARRRRRLGGLQGSQGEEDDSG